MRPDTLLPRIAALGATFGLLATTASAQLIHPVSQERTLEADVQVQGGPSASDDFVAPDFAPVSEQISVIVTNSSLGRRADAAGSQDSAITGTSITASSAFHATAEGWQSEATSLSRCRVVFTLTEACRYDLSGFTTAYDNGGSWFTLRSVTGPFVFSAQAPGFTSTYQFDVSGTMLPGTYIFDAVGGGEAVEPSPNDYGSGSFDVDLQLSPAMATDCIPSANSSGQEALFAFTGDLRVGSIETYYLVEQGPPGHSGVMFYGDAMAPATFGNGVLCVSNPLFRAGPPRQFNAMGRVYSPLYYHHAPMNGGAGHVIPGSTWTFQFWFRDYPGPSGDAWNTSSAVTVTFAP